MDGEVPGTKPDSPKDKRKLTAAELRRKENFEKIENDLIFKGYKRVDLTVSILKANLGGLLSVTPLITLLVLGFILRYKITEGAEPPVSLHMSSHVRYLVFIAASVAFIFMHEGIHGLCWSLGTPNGLKDIEFGFVKEMLTPYCTCKVPLSKPFFIFGSLMPMTVLGIIPSVIAIFLGSPFLLLLFIIQVIGGAGDFLIILKLLSHKRSGNDVVLLDHPYECGLVLFEK